MKNNFKVIIFYVVLIGVILIAAASLLNGANTSTLKYGDVVRLFNEEQVDKFTVDAKNNIIITKKDQTVVSYKLRDLSLFYSDLGEKIAEQYENGVIKEFDYPAPNEIPWWVSYLPFVLLFGVFIALWFFMMNQATGRGSKINAFGRAKAKMGADEKKKVYFRDVAGADEEKEELEEVVEFLKDPAKFSRLGARIPHGVLLVGPPGTGKTLLAKAVAGEAGVPFFSISGSDFVEMYVGVGASRVRDLFENAKKNPASIIFIDEIDAVGRHRGAGLGGGHDEREQTLNQLLVEMDGFGSNDGVIVMAATNRPDILDPALLRPGRFDRQITVNYPDLRGREDILKVHARGKPFEAEVDLAKVAQSTVGFTGADLANLLNEAALLAAKKGKSLIGMNDIEESSLKITVGTQKKSARIKEEEKRKTAYHEAGHAILAHLLPTLDPVRLISVIPSGRALGYTFNPPKEDKYSVYRNGLVEEITMLLGGRAAEKIVFDDISGGAANDIQRATAIARNMVTRYGMSDRLGPILLGSEHSDEEVFLGRDFNSGANYSQETAAVIDEEIHAIIDGAYKNAQKTLADNRAKLDFIAEYLVRHESMDEEQFSAVMNGDPTVEELEAINADKRRRSEEENHARAERNERERLRREEEERRRAEHDRRAAPHDTPDTPDTPDDGDNPQDGE